MGRQSNKNSRKDTPMTPFSRRALRWTALTGAASVALIVAGSVLLTAQSYMLRRGMPGIGTPGGAQAQSPLALTCTLAETPGTTFPLATCPVGTFVFDHNCYVANVASGHFESLLTVSSHRCQFGGASGIAQAICCKLE